jgi:hypothetical protein
MSPDRHLGVHGQPVPEEASLSVQPSRLGPVYRKERMAGRGPQQYSNCRDLREIPDMDNITHSGTTKGPLRCREAWAWAFELGESSSSVHPSVVYRCVVLHMHALSSHVAAGPRSRVLAGPGHLRDLEIRSGRSPWRARLLWGKPHLVLINLDPNRPPCRMARR